MEEPDAAESPAPEGVGMQSHSDSSELSASDLSSDDLVDDDGMASCEVTEALIEEKIKSNDVNSLYSCLSNYKSEDIEQIRKIRVAAVPYLSPYRGFWKNWISDEISLVKSLEDIINVLELFEVSLDKVYSISLWSKFVSFIVDNFISSKLSALMSEGDVREVCIRAVNATKNDFVRGIKVWNKYILFEKRLIELSEPKKRSEQILRVRKAYIEQLHVPHKDLEETFNSYSAFEASSDIDNYEANLSNASKIVSESRRTCQKFQHYENELLTTSYHMLAFDEYLEFLRTYKPDPTVIFVLYERALKKYYFQEYFWSSYIVDMYHIMPKTPKLKSLVVRARSVLKKSMLIWEHYVNIMQADGNSEQDNIQDSFRSLVQTSESAYELFECIRIMQEYYIRRLSVAGSAITPEFINNSYQQGVNLIFERFGKSDYIVELVMHAIRFNMYKNIDDIKVRSLYNFACKEYPDKSALWISYSQFELTKNEHKKAVNILKDALMRKTDYPESVISSLKNVESENGSVDQLYSSLWLIQKEMVKMNRRRQKEYAQSHAQLQNMQDGERGQNMENDTIKNSTVVGVKRKRLASDNDNIDAVDVRDHKNVKDMSNKPIDIYSYHEINNNNAGCMIYVTNLPYRADEDKIKNIFSQCGRMVDIIMQSNQTTGDIEAYVEFSNANEVRNALNLNEEVYMDEKLIKIQRCKPIHNVWDYPMNHEPKKIYVSNLSPDIMKKQLRNAFSKFGKIVEVNLVLRKKATFAYLEFETADAANLSLSMNGTAFIPGWNQKISVLISDPSKSKPKVIDAKELFVNNLSYNLQIEDIKQLFDAFGENEVRMPKDKGGQFKGFAFVTYKDEDSASKALSLNSTLFHGRIINVSIADHVQREKKRQNKLKKKNIASKTLAEGYTNRANTTSSISMIPSSVLKATSASNKPRIDADLKKQESLPLQSSMDTES